MGGGLLPTPTPPLVPFARFVCRGNAGDRGACVGGPLLGVCWKPALGLKVETLFWKFLEGGGPDWVVVFEVDDVAEVEVEVEAEREADRAGDEGSEFVCGVMEGEEGGFWKSL